jgi:putative ABC transport system permease protein
LTLVGIVDPPSPFISTPLIYTSMTTAALIRPGIAPTFVVVRANDGVDAGALAQEISKASGYAAFPSDMFKELTIDYYLKNTGIPINFFITITLGFIVGAAIVAQTFYLFVTENLKHLSVFKAMGAKAPQLLSMTAIQCAVVTATGFSIGAAGAAWFFESVPDKVPAFKGFYLPFGVLAKTFLAVTGVALLSGFLSIQRALRIDPAEVLRA